MQFYTIHLPVKTYIRKYLEQRFGNPIVIDGKTIISDIVLSKLSSKLNSKLPPTDIDTRLNRFTDQIPIRIPFHYWYSLEKTFSQHSIVRINRFFENSFEEDLHKHVDLQMRYIPKMERKTAIESFAAEHRLDIELDITFEAMKKMEYRHRQEKENSKKSLSGLSRAISMFQ